MAGQEHSVIPFVVMYLLFQIPPTILELVAYYGRGGLVPFDTTLDDTFHQTYQMYDDWHIYLKRFADRPQSEASRSYYAYLDWSAAAWDKSIYIHRRNLEIGRASCRERV